MKKISCEILINQLQSDTRDIILQLTKLTNVPVYLLEKIPSHGAWSIAQVLEHLNIYARYYIHAIEHQLASVQKGSTPIFQSGWLGNYFANLMKPSADGKLRSKMVSPKNARPQRYPGGQAMLMECLDHQHQLLNLLDISRHANLSAIRIPTSLSKWLRLSLGDTFRFVIAHQQRHMLQIERVLHQINQSIYIHHESINKSHENVIDRPWSY